MATVRRPCGQPRVITSTYLDSIQVADCDNNNQQDPSNPSESTDHPIEDVVIASKSTLSVVDNNKKARVVGYDPNYDGNEVFNDYNTNHASGTANHVEGFNNHTTDTNYSHIEGSLNGCKNGNNIHIEGKENSSTHNLCHIEGRGNNSFCDFQHIQGEYAASDFTYRDLDKPSVYHAIIDVIGDGKSDNNRSNLEYTAANGLKWLKEDVTCKLSTDASRNGQPQHYLSTKIREPHTPDDPNDTESFLVGKGTLDGDGVPERFWKPRADLIAEILKEISVGGGSNNPDNEDKHYYIDLTFDSSDFGLVHVIDLGANNGATYPHASDFHLLNNTETGYYRLPIGLQCYLVSISEKVSEIDPDNPKPGSKPGSNPEPSPYQEQNDEPSVMSSNANYYWSDIKIVYRFDPVNNTLVFKINDDFELITYNNTIDTIKPSGLDTINPSGFKLHNFDIRIIWH